MSDHDQTPGEFALRTYVAHFGYLFGGLDFSRNRTGDLPPSSRACCCRRFSRAYGVGINPLDTDEEMMTTC